MVEIRPQPGPQEMFLTTDADIAVYGGAAGGGKSFSLLMEGLRHIRNPAFNSTTFRRTTTQIRNNGGLWDESLRMYIPYGTPKESRLEWVFSSGSKSKFAHIEYDKDVYNYQGAQIPLIMFDELTHFSWKQFSYMMSRNRSTCGVRPYIRGTCNPDPDSFVLEMIDWYLDHDGYADKTKAGVIRYLYVLNDEFLWGFNPEEMKDKYKQDELPLSFTFIPSQIEDNKILLESDPSYLVYLNSLGSIDKEQLRYGNWYAKDISNRRYYGFDKKRHIVDFPFHDELPIYIGQDFNVDKMGGICSYIIEDKMFIFDNIYLTEKNANTYSLRDHVKQKYGVDKVRFIPDSTGKNRKSSAKLTDFQILQEYNFKIEHTRNPLREDRFNTVNGLFEKDRIIIHPRCHHLIKDLNVTEKTDKETCADRGHITDGLGYVAWKYFPLLPYSKKKIHNSRR